jgi:hypothetical protein
VDANGREFRATGAELGFRLDKPFYWRVTDGVLYAEMPFSAAIRPPLLTEWESQHVARFRNPGRRAGWLAGRALAKALVREHLSLQGIVEIREGSEGEPLVYSAGMPMPDVWLGISCRGGRVAAVVADRPVSLDIRVLDGSDLALGAKLMHRSELRSLRRVLQSASAAAGAVRAIKEAALRATRLLAGPNPALAGVFVDADLSVEVGGARLHVMALRVLDTAVVAVVGRQIAGESPITRIVMDEPAAAAAAAAADEPGPSGIQAALERSMARARRIADGRARWQRRPRWT